MGKGKEQVGMLQMTLSGQAPPIGFGANLKKRAVGITAMPEHPPGFGAECEVFEARAPPFRDAWDVAADMVEAWDDVEIWCEWATLLESPILTSDFSIGEQRALRWQHETEALWSRTLDALPAVPACARAVGGAAALPA